ncbi:MAG: chromosome segregation protein SMC [Chloroflexi bacterium RBG_16_58_14]|nr:MAG: chromosome segregation protein SMC [Chloroflexi bacterium RBG_16_58_14]
MPSHLKSLELQGYKTFASRTLFEFDGAITCIVGPNGSGKSNIADSLRWVLGEQSYLLLRGKRTEDMIFSGSEQRPRAGMASASVLFDNSDGWLPIDFSEVSITRRAYRDGENEYLINGQRVRLKDVTELLAQSGLAERTYTIIGQGVVDAALALKPEERRRLFEEAAGIGLHRGRREEALRRLETTRRNLERVHDILTELQPRLRSLERQAKRALEYDQVKTTLRDLLREWYGFHWHRAQQDLTAARSMARSKEKELAQARREQTALAGKLDVSRQEIYSLREQLNEWHHHQAQLHTQREELSRQLAVADERIRSLGSQEQELNADVARLEEESALQQARTQVTSQALERLKTELDEARLQAEAVRASLQSRLDERQALEVELEAARHSQAAHETRRAQLNARLEEQRSQLIGQRGALETAQQAAVVAEAALVQARDRSRRAGDLQVQAEAVRQQAETGLSELRLNIEGMESTRIRELEQRAGLQAELARTQAQIDVLEQAEASLSGYARGAQLLLQAARQARLPGARGALSSQLEVSADLEIAIAAALGEFLDAVLLEADSDADQALDLLVDSSSRAVLLPLDGIRTGNALQANGKGVLGVAAGLVTAPGDLQPLLELLLGNTLVVSDRQAARQALQGQPAGVRAVTLRGEVFHASGPVVAGVEGKPASLSRPRQMKELQQKLQEIAARVGRVDARLVQVGAELEDLRQASQQLEGEMESARSAESVARTAHSRAVVEAEQAARQAAWQAEQQVGFQTAITRLEESISRTGEELNASLASLEGSRQEVGRCIAALQDLALDDFQSQLTYWNALVAATERSLEESISRLGEQGDAHRRSQAVLVAAQDRLVTLNANLQEIEGGRVAQRRVEGEIGHQIDALREQVQPAEAELEAAEHLQNELQMTEAAARQTLTLAEHTHAQARIGLGRAQEALDSLSQRIQDDFGLVAFDYEEEISGPTPLPLQGMVEQLPRLTELPVELEENLRQQRATLRRIGPVNLEAQAEFQEVKERFEFMTTQVADLEKAVVDVRQVISELDELMESELLRTFEAVAEEFGAIFTRLFGGGSARLKLTNPEDLSNAGIDIEARLPGRRVQGLSLLSGGERSLTAAALIFALIKISPTPFCVLDEVDAMLDEVNVSRFRELLRELSQTTQFIVVTHNRNTVQAADVIYGVTMGRDSSSQVIGLKLDEVSKVV